MEYYKPKPEDLRLGYECEVYYPSGWYKYLVEDLQCGSDGSSLIGDLNWYIEEGLYEVRTPFLTKEQIEGEGWKHTGNYRDGGSKGFEKGNYYLFFTGDNSLYREVFGTKRNFSKIEILEDKKFKTLFEGVIKSINELRTIQKLLKIK